jgi:hypothetical protein
LSQAEWEILKSKNPEWNEVDLRDNRYDQVIHMVDNKFLIILFKLSFYKINQLKPTKVTAANGAESFYTLSNNETRTESIEDARESDDRLLKSWV